MPPLHPIRNPPIALTRNECTPLIASYPILKLIFRFIS
jgi:hypothetical protein